MKMSGRYSLGLYAGVTGILALVAINAFTIPDSIESAHVRDRLTSQAALEQTKAETAKRTQRLLRNRRANHRHGRKGYRSYNLGSSSDT